MNNINEMYTDISPNMDKAWNRDIAKSVGARSVKNAVLGIVTTRKGGKPFEPDFGCDIEQALFENMTPLTANTFERTITAAIRQYEPRIVRLAVGVTPEYDANSVIVDIRFSILDNPDVLQTIKLQLRS